MGQFWALWLFSLILRGLGIMGFVLTLITACIASAVPFIGVMWFIYGTVLSLTFYGAGQFILLMMSIHDSSSRTSGILGIRGRRPAPRPDPSINPWDDEPAAPLRDDWVRAPAQRNNTPVPRVPKDEPFRPRPRTDAQRARDIQRDMNRRRDLLDE